MALAAPSTSKVIRLIEIERTCDCCRLIDWALLGDIYLPIWGPITTTESRLIVTSCEEKEYDNTKYEEQMFYFNTVTRVARYPHNVTGEGFDHCYDCRAEVVDERLQMNLMINSSLFLD